MADLSMLIQLRPFLWIQRGSIDLSPFVPGQRWVSDTEPELGLGTVIDADAQRVTILYIACGERRIYARRNPPLTRVRFGPGDTVMSVDGWSMTVSAIEDDQSVFTYVGADNQGKQRRLEEIELDHHLQFSKPQERLFAGQIDPSSLFRLRIETLRRLEQLESSPVRGLLGPRVSLLPHQLYIAQEVATRHAPRVLLADEVGLGKTIEAGMIVHHRLLTGRAERVLLIVPETLIHQWLVEMLRRFNLRFALFDEDRYLEIDAPNPFLVESLVLCSLEWLVDDPERQRLLLSARWDLCVVDEAHHLRWTPGHASEEYRFVEHLSGIVPGLVLLTATPEQWGKAGHYARLRLLDPDRFHDFDVFLDEERHYRSLVEVLNAILDHRSLDEDESVRLREFLAHDRAEDLLAQLTDPDRSDTARSALIQLLLDRHGTGRVLFRNTRATVKGFPPREPRFAPLTPPDCYRQLLQNPELPLAERLNPEVLLQGTGEGEREWWRQDPRVNWLIALLQELKRAKALVICARATTALDLEAALRIQAGIRAAVFHEGMSIVERDRAAAWFADQDEEGARVLVCSEIGSEGRNFQFAHHLVLFDLPLNPDLLEQRIGRLDRIGQSETIRIHIPYLEHSAQQVLQRWYHEGLNAFQQPCPAGQQVFQQLEEELRTALAERDTQRTDSLIAVTRALNGEFCEALHAGRDRLLELNSCRPEQARQFVAQIEHTDRDARLWTYLEAVFDAYGVNVEDHSHNCFVLTPGDHLRVPHFPELPDEGVTVTINRDIALAREDMLFLTWEHPLVRGAIDLILNSEHGNASFGLVRHPDLAPGQLLLEAFLLLEAAGPRRLQVGRFLPPTVIRILVDGQGEEVSDNIVASLVEQQAPVVGDELRQLLRAQRPLVETLIRRVEHIGQARLSGLVASAQDRMLASMTSELKRLAALRRANPSVRQEELDLLKQEGLELHATLAAAQLRLEALRVLVTIR